MDQQDPSNQQIAEVLEQIAGLLEKQDANPFRVRAYREGAERVRAADRSLAELVRAGKREQLTDLPDIGEGLAGTISEFVETGRSRQLDRLRGEASPAYLFTKVPGIGVELAERVANQLKIDSLEELEQAAHDGRLGNVGGFGPKRVKAVQTSLAGMLSPAAQRRVRQRTSGEEPPSEQPEVGTLLEVDREYRRKAGAGELRTIAPRRFNPENKAWLPILHTERGEWDFTALYSNTKRAHELDKTDDWVVIYYQRAGKEAQCTVVTETSGLLEGKRVVRGREDECRRYYAEVNQS